MLKTTGLFIAALVWRLKVHGQGFNDAGGAHGRCGPPLWQASILVKDQDQGDAERHRFRQRRNIVETEIGKGRVLCWD
jgi:hypothetical protein